MKNKTEMEDSQAVKQIKTANQLVKALEEDFSIEEVTGIIEMAKIFAMEIFYKKLRDKRK